MAWILHTGSAGYRLPSSLRRLGISERNIFNKPLEDMRDLVEAIESLLAEGHHQPHPSGPERLHR